VTAFIRCDGGVYINTDHIVRFYIGPASTTTLVLTDEDAYGWPGPPEEFAKAITTVERHSQRITA
jgi:hypothetical protein